MPPKTETPAICLATGKPVTEGFDQIDPSTGMQKDYIVLCPEERDKGFVRPLRYTYRHIGEQLKYPLRELTADEHERLDQYNYVMFETYPDSYSPVTGRYWRQDQLDRLNKCGYDTTMGQSIAETYARDPSFYGSTFCVHCGQHFPVTEFVWEDGTVVGS